MLRTPIHKGYMAYFLEGMSEYNLFSELLKVTKVFVNFNDSIVDLKDIDQK